MSEALVKTNVAVDRSAGTSSLELERAREASGLAETLQRIAQDAATDASAYLSETIVPEGGE